MKPFSHSIRLSTATVLAMALGSYVFATEAKADDIRDISRVNQGITVESAERVGDVSSINGGIRIEENASAYEVSTINGSITLSDDAQIDDAETVNGRIRVGSEVTVKGSLETINGSIRVERGSTVAHNIETVNGGIGVRNAYVGQDIETSNGSIDILEGSIVEGDVIIHGRHHWWERLFKFTRNRPEITIDSESVVRGNIHLYQEVELNISEDADIGEVIEHF